MENLLILREPEARAALGLPHSTFRLRVKEGLIPEQIKIEGTRTSGWPAHEINTVVAAMMVGKTKDEIKGLVKSLVQQRKEIFQSLTRHFPQAA